MYLFGVNNRLSPRPLFRPICNVRKRTGETARRYGALICRIPRLAGEDTLQARIDTTLFDFNEHGDQAGPGKQGFKRLGRVIGSKFKQLKGVS